MADAGGRRCAGRLWRLAAGDGLPACRDAMAAGGRGCPAGLPGWSASAARPALAEAACGRPGQVAGPILPMVGAPRVGPKSPAISIGSVKK
jgi:hypothetical protein